MPKKQRILVVEDEPDTLDMLVTFFETQGYEVMTAMTGYDALDICSRTLPDIIIQDIRLPDIDGYEVCRRLRQSLRTSQIPVLFLTEKKARGDKIAGLKLGAVDYITKPFDPRELGLRVRNTLRRASFESLVSPVTGLPEVKVVDDRLQEILRHDEWALLAISIINLDYFNETYGFVAGDDVLRAVSLIINNVVEESGTLDDFVGHVGKADFLLITVPSKVEELRDKIVTRLCRAIQYFYPIKDREASRQRPVLDREHMMAVAVGTVTPEHGPFKTVQELKEAAARRREVIPS